MRPLSHHPWENLAKEAALSDPAPDPILVALSAEATTLRLVHAGFRLAREQKRPWLAVHVEVPDWETAQEADQARIWLQEARALGAETAWVRAATVSEGIILAGAGRSPALVVMGRNRPRTFWDRLERSRAQEVIRRGLRVPIARLPVEEPAQPPETPGATSDLLGKLLASAMILGLCAIFGSALASVAGFPGVPPVFALGVGFIAHRWGRAWSLPATLAVLLLYPVLYHAGGFPLRTEDWTSLGYFAGALLLVQVVVVLVDRLHQETRSLHRREAETFLLMLLGQALGHCSTVREVAEVLAERFRGMFQVATWLLVPADGDAWRRFPEAPEAPSCPPPSELLPRLNDPARQGSPAEPLFLRDCSFVPLAGAGGREGLLQLRREAGGRLPAQSWSLFQSAAVQGALALERVRWLEEAQQARLDSESERMRNTLLGAVSHDLRTPLAAIQGAATSLLLPEPLPEATRADLLAMIRDESERLARLLGDLLSLTRLQSGAIHVQKEWQLLDEVVGSAVMHLENREGRLPIRVELPPDLPLVPLDGALMEQVLVNLLVNARRHAPGSPVLVRAWEEPGAINLEVADRGPGIPPELHERVFDKFFRMPNDLKDGGVGLGLAICGAIVKIHGGSIWVEDRPGGGARFRIALPLEGRPPEPPDLDRPALPEPEP